MKQRDFIIINKPPGFSLCIQVQDVFDNTLANGLIFKYPELAHLPRSGIVHRLDKDTSGCIADC